LRDFQDFATQIVSLTEDQGRAYFEGPMKLFSLPLLLIGSLVLSSCSLIGSATRLPIRTLQGVGRAVGLGLEQTEVRGEEQAAKPTKWESVRGD
jgi:hypothetical protein